MGDVRIVKVVPISADALKERETLQAAADAASTAYDKARGALSNWHHETLVRLYPEHYIEPKSRMDVYGSPAAVIKIVDGYAVIGLERH